MEGIESNRRSSVAPPGAHPLSFGVDHRRTPLPAALLLALSSGILVALGPDRAMVPLAILPWTVAFLALLHLHGRHAEWLGRPTVLLGGALLLRVLFYLPFPDLSDDIFRYLWDGVVALEGTRPYTLRPSDPALTHLHELELFREMNSPEYISIYPPLSQYVFLAGGLLYRWLGFGVAAYGVKAGFLLMEIGGLLLLHGALRRFGRTPEALALYAWNPLVLLAVAGGGHTEGGLVLGLGLLLFGLAMAPGRRRTMAVWAGWGIAVLAKGIPLVVAPLLWRALGRESGRGAVLVGTLGGMGLLSLPFLRPEDLWGIAESAQLYVRLFEFNAGLHTLLRGIVEGSPWSDLGVHVGSLLRTVFLVGALWIGLRHPVRDGGEVARGTLLVLSLYLVCATTVHPWYLLWVLPLLPFTTLLRGAWLWGSWATLPTYLTYIGVPHGPLTALFWGGWLGVAAHEGRERLLSPLRRRAAPRKARWIRTVLPEGSRSALDLGGGEGWVGRELRREAGGPLDRVYLADPMAIDGSMPDRTLRASGESLPFGDGSVDVVLLSFVLHHTRDPDRVLSEALRVARESVVILETTPATQMGARLLEPLDRWVNSGRGDGSMGRANTPIHYRSRKEWVRAVETLGGRCLRVDRPNRIGHPVTRLVAVRPARGDG